MIDNVLLNLLVNGSATGDWYEWGGGKGEFSVDGTFSGATIKLQYKGPNGTAKDAGTDTTLTAEGGGTFTLARNTQIRVTITGGPPSGVYATAKSVT